MHPTYFNAKKPTRRKKLVLFNDALNSFYLRLYGVGHMVKDHSDNERGNPLPPHRLLFPPQEELLTECNSSQINCAAKWLCKKIGFI